MKKGIFWCVNVESTQPQLITVSVNCDADGHAESKVTYSSKSGDNFNHSVEWQKLDKHITRGYPYNYYPRGRVEIKRNKAVIFINPVLNTKAIIEKIFEVFELSESDNLKSISVKCDGSRHYKYLLDQ